MEEPIKKLHGLADEWQKWAKEQVPEYYTKRDLEQIYLRGDTIAAGYSECADSLHKALQELDIPNASLQKSGLCKWVYDDEQEYYYTGCGSGWVPERGTTSPPEGEFCLFCGRRRSS